MTPLVGAEQMRELDRITIEELGIPSLVLMETAGRAVAEAVARMDPRGPVLIVAGRGNNGGDGVVVARALVDRGVPVQVMVLGSLDRVSKDLGHQLAVARRLKIEVEALGGAELEARLRAALSGAAVVVDAIFGTGLAREVTGDAALAVGLIRASNKPVVAVDIPTGIDADTGQVLGVAVRADVTVTFAFPKLGHALYPGRAHSGRLEVVDIGIPRSLVSKPSAIWLDDSIIERARPPRAPDAHKGSFGHLGVIAGSADRPGAALLACRAGLRAGAGLVSLASSRSVIERLGGSLLEVMGLSAGEDELSARVVIDGLTKRRVNALAIGPSLDPCEGLESFLREVLDAIAVPVVLDAGALDALGSDPSWLKAHAAGVVLTPHPGEMARVLGLDTATVQGARLEAARGLAEVSGATVVLKGASTVISDPDGTVGIVTRGHPGMATGGSGDVLTGIIGALLAQGSDVPLAARAGAQLHALAGDRAKEARGHRLIASDLVEALAGS
ncbi:MAG: NAD(P)H-hydrate dehydratase [Deltaproteobacteria bacterium]|nr:NAD(P)H-hydrate dehydratase [Deltaproteobacteria bacterium]